MACLVMTSSASAAVKYLRQLQAPLTPLLRDLGFTRHNRIYNRIVNDGLVQVVYFWMEQFYSSYEPHSRPEHRVSVRIGIHLPCMWRIEHRDHPIPLNKPTDIAACEIQRGLHDLPRGWFTPAIPPAFPLNEDTLRHAPKIASLIVKVGVSFLNSLDSYDQIIERWVKGPSGKNETTNRHRRALVGAVIEVDRHATGEALKLFEAAREGHTHMGFLQHIDKVQSLLGLLPIAGSSTPIETSSTEPPPARARPALDEESRFLVEAHLDLLAAYGLLLNPGVQPDDLADCLDNDALHKQPFTEVLLALGAEADDEQCGPNCDRVWLLDTECIEDNGDYVAIVERLGTLTGGALQLENLTDKVDTGGVSAVIRFRHQGRDVRWRAEINDDWLDTQIIVRYDQLLESSGSDVGIYASAENYGQQVLLVGLTAGQYAAFSANSPISLSRVLTTWVNR
jgi:hypothetical protein